MNSCLKKPVLFMGLALLSFEMTWGEKTHFLPLAQAQNTSGPASPSRPIVDVKLVVRLSHKKVYLYQAGNMIISYPIAIGKKGWETPTGNFKVMEMVRDPAWENPFNGTVIPPGADNPLGERWIGFWSDGKNAIGFHGTRAENLIGQAVSHGCIRMRNKDVKSLFEKIQIGTPVIVEK